MGTEPINVTPLIDVVMCLIIFFLIVGKLAADESVRLSLPQSAVGDGNRSGSAVVVTVLTDSSPGSLGGVVVSIDGSRANGPAQIAPLLRSAAEARLKASGQPVDSLALAGVTVRADRRLPYDAVKPVVSAAASLGIAKLEYATERTP